MKLKNGYTLVEKEDYFTVLAPDGSEIKSFNLNKYSVFLWNCIEKENLTSTELLNRLLAIFPISTVLGLGEIDTFIKKCKENGILE
ncbi:MAG: PqqD family protein [Clostridia bacterium]|nr:PqqD family protein [Clostridia bacterium]